MEELQPPSSAPPARDADRPAPGGDGGRPAHDEPPDPDRGQRLRPVQGLRRGTSARPCTEDLCRTCRSMCCLVFVYDHGRPTRRDARMRKLAGAIQQQGSSGPIRPPAAGRLWSTGSAAGSGPLGHEIDTADWPSYLIFLCGDLMNGPHFRDRQDRGLFEKPPGVPGRTSTRWPSL